MTPFRVYPWAQMGWGAHQALARLEFGEVEEARPALPATVVYWAIADHTRRLLGERDWDRKGPRYALDAGGRATFAGSPATSAPARPLRSAGASLARRSLVWKRLQARGAPRSACARGDVEPRASVVERMREEAGRTLPNCRFGVLLETGDTDGTTMEAALRRRGIEIVAIGDLLGEDRVSAPRWKLDPHDGYPSALGTAKIASGLAAWIDRGGP